MKSGGRKPLGRFSLINCNLSVRRLLTKASLREGGGPLAVEGACGAVRQNSFHRNAFSLSRLRRQLPPGGSLTAKICVVKLPYKSKFEKLLLPTTTEKFRQKKQSFQKLKRLLFNLSLLQVLGFLKPEACVANSQSNRLRFA